MATVTLANTTANLSGAELLKITGTHTITGAFTFDRDPSAPFIVTSGSAVVSNLDADKVDGYQASELAVLAEAETVSGAWAFTGVATLTSPQINTTLASASLFSGFCQGRLTLTSGTPVTITDVTAATTMYFTPYKGNLIALYDGSATWTVYPFTERSLALGTLTDDLPYDVFAYDNSGTVTLEFTAWTNGTTRATALTTQNGVLVKTGATTRRYLGTFRTDTTTTTEDSFAKRFVWNYYNRVPRSLRVLEATNSWAYTIATIRQANGSTANQLAVVIGVAEVELEAYVQVQVASDQAAGSIVAHVGIGEDSTTTIHTSCVRGGLFNPAANVRISPTASLRLYPAVGYHFYAWLERSTAAGTTTWYGDDNGLLEQSGIHGSIMG